MHTRLDAAGREKEKKSGDEESGGKRNEDEVEEGTETTTGRKSLRIKSTSINFHLSPSG